MKLNKQEMTGCTKITLIISGAAMLAGIVIVVLFAAEELGVLGAGHYLKSMPFPKDKITCMVNIDMLGKGNGLMVNTATEHGITGVVTIGNVRPSASEKSG